ncbi:hypothetical protein HPB47_010759 [Ixodes persulcatus]|uniref:Uncharacterized protein n=1 Tax=Ixodes persulcatus TaxID=34615 RepID=A0AC60NY96_IXOPE|nr:hypothetical protein HPB47_010759 [Ixodes persulcatus]
MRLLDFRPVPHSEAASNLSSFQDVALPACFPLRGEWGSTSDDVKRRPRPLHSIVFLPACGVEHDCWPRGHLTRSRSQGEGGQEEGRLDSLLSGRKRRKRRLFVSNIAVLIPSEETVVEMPPARCGSPGREGRGTTRDSVTALGAAPSERGTRKRTQSLVPRVAYTCPARSGVRQVSEEPQLRHAYTRNTSTHRP